MIRDFNFNNEIVQMLKNVDSIPTETVDVNSVPYRYFSITAEQKAEVTRIAETLNTLPQTELEAMTDNEKWEYASLLNQAERVLKNSVERLGFEDGIYIRDELIIDDDHINAYIETWFDVEKRFGLDLNGDGSLDLYADYYPADRRLDVYYLIKYDDDRENETTAVQDLTDAERDAILKAMRQNGLDDCVSEMEQIGQKYDKLPDICFSTNILSGELVVIKNGESGYHSCDWSTNDPLKNRVLADAHNSEMGVTKAQEVAMVSGSMFGWDVPAAKPQNYDENVIPTSRPEVKNETAEIIRLYCPINVCFVENQFKDDDMDIEDMWMDYEMTPKEAAQFFDIVKQEFMDAPELHELDDGMEQLTEIERYGSLPSRITKTTASVELVNGEIWLVVGCQVSSVFPDEIDKLKEYVTEQLDALDSYTEKELESGSLYFYFQAEPEYFSCCGGMTAEQLIESNLLLTESELIEQQNKQQQTLDEPYDGLQLY